MFHDFDRMVKHGVSLLRTGDLEGARITAEQIISSFPEHACANHLLGIIAAQQGLHQKAADYIRTAIMSSPDYADAYISQGNVYWAMGRPAQAIISYKQAIQLGKNDAITYYNLGNALRDLNKNNEALSAYNEACRLNFPSAVIHHNRVAALRDLGRQKDALDICNMLLRNYPASSESYLILAIILSDLDKHSEAVDACRQAIDFEPASCLAHFTMGNILRDSGKPENALASYQKACALNPDYIEARTNHAHILSMLGHTSQALRESLQIVTDFPDSAEAQYNYGNLLRDSRQFDSSIAAYDKAIDLRTDYVEAHCNKGEVLIELWRLSEAISCCAKAISINPYAAEIYCNLAKAQMESGDLYAAEDNYRHALKLRPDYKVAHSGLLYVLAATERSSPDVLLTELQRWDAIHGEFARSKPLSTCRNQPTRGRRLRIGYVSPDMRRHAVSYFFEPLLSAHNRERFEIFCYANLHPQQTDNTTQRLQDFAEHWRFVKGLDDRNLARLIYNDNIDVLVDLAGHTANNRLVTFTYHPAPVQATYLGFFGPSGLEAMDYWITDRVLHPADTREIAVEQIYRLPRCAFCYQPPAEAPPVSPCPNYDNNVVFGSCNSLSKLNDTLIGAWSRIMDILSGSRLLVMAKPLVDKRIHAQLLERFRNAGIDPSRLILTEGAALPEYLAMYSNIDIVLDNFPRTGGTTTAEALWMGVPVVTLAGKTYAGRISASKLFAVNLEDLITYDVDSYVDVAVALANDSQRRIHMRNNLRSRMSASPLCNGRELASTIENAYIDMARNIQP